MSIFLVQVCYKYITTAKIQLLKLRVRTSKCIALCKKQKGEQCAGGFWQVYSLQRKSPDVYKNTQKVTP